MPDLSLLWLCFTAFAAGAVNSIAGGGTLLTFPALMAALTPLRGAAMAAVLANATSTAALVPGSMAGPGVTGIRSVKPGGGSCC